MNPVDGVNEAIKQDIDRLTKGAAMQYVNGLLFGAGFITAALIMKVLFHVTVCG